MSKSKWVRSSAALGVALALAAAGTFASDASAHSNRNRGVLGGPLFLQDEGSFFVGGEVVTTQFTGAETGSYVRKQMYVHYRVPVEKKHPWPIVLVHGGGLTGATYETTPDGREGWDTYFVRKGFTVYVVDEPGRGRAGFDPESINRGRAEANIALVPSIRRFTQELAWTFFRIGPTYPTPYPNTKFPIAAAQELSAQGVPYAESTFQGGGPATAPPALAALLDRIGPAIVISHSLGGPHTDQLVGLRPQLLKGVINLEAVQLAVSDQIVAAYANFPSLELFGDNVLGNPVGTGQARYDARSALVQRINAAGGDAEVVLLADKGFIGNTHMLMQETNNLKIADWLIRWIDKNVETRRGGHHGH